VLSAYVLIQTEVGKVAHVARALSGLEGAQLAEDITGPYDFIASSSSNCRPAAAMQHGARCRRFSARPTGLTAGTESPRHQSTTGQRWPCPRQKWESSWQAGLGRPQRRCGERLVASLLGELGGLAWKRRSNACLAAVAYDRRPMRRGGAVNHR
jgi:hypothetical protein